MEVFTNCATAANTFLLFYLLLNGSGVGRAYDDDMIKATSTTCRSVCRSAGTHKDVENGSIVGYPDAPRRRAPLCRPQDHGVRGARQPRGLGQGARD
jgi:hypothetical protein